MKQPGPRPHTMRDPVPQIIPSEEIQAYAVYFANELIKKKEKNPHFEIDLSFYPDRTAYETGAARASAGPVHTEKRGDRFTIHICEEDLKNIPSQALQGWMEHETMRCIQSLNPDYAQINFKKNIFPLMPVTGLAENHILELIRSIEAGLKGYFAVKALIRMGGGVQQAYFHFFKMRPVADDRRLYEKALPHPWTNALFLCRKFRELMPVSCLVDKNIEFSPDLASFWWQSHDYLIPRDKMFLEKLSRIPLGFVDTSYTDIVIALFKAVKSRYLIAPKDTVGSTSPSPTLH